jgi:hypothetical protein
MALMGAGNAPASWNPPNKAFIFQIRQLYVSPKPWTAAPACGVLEME